MVYAQYLESIINTARRQEHCRSSGVVNGIADLQETLCSMVVACLDFSEIRDEIFQDFSPSCGWAVQLVSA